MDKHSKGEHHGERRVGNNASRAEPQVHVGKAVEGAGKLYVVATPIGNLSDITRRALDVLAAVDLIAAEDTRTTGQLLAHHGVSAKLTALHEHNEAARAASLVEKLAAGTSIALVSDAGTPGISDPGALLVAQARAAGIEVCPIPGANAAIAALSAAGMAEPHFLFYGFLPARSAARKKALEVLRESPQALVFYEAPHRVLECVADLAATLGPGREVVIARELTKLFESMHRLPLADALAWLEADANRQRGEFVLIVSGAPERSNDAFAAEAGRVLGLLLDELPLKQAVSLAAGITGLRRNELYARALELRGTGAGRDDE